MRRPARPLRYWVLTLLLCALPARAQRTLVLQGSVVDVTGAAIPGVTLHLQAAAGGNAGDAVADAQGKFRFRGLRAGEFTLVVPPYSGFEASTVPVHLTGPPADLQVVLKLGQVSEEVTVTAGTELSTDAAANQDTIAVDAAQLRKLPVFDQDFVAALTPFLDGASGPATIIVDGVEMKTAGVSASAIQEVRINSDPYTAEFNRPGRGRIEIITKPGSPDFRGELNFTYRNALFNARNHFATTRPPESRSIYEGHLSGPIGKSGSTSFILSGSRHIDDTATPVNALDITGPVHQDVLTPTEEMQFSGRVTHDFSPKHRMAVGYSYQEDKTTNEGVGGLVLAEAGINRSAREDDLIFNDRLIVTPKLVNQLQVTLEKDDDTTVSVTNAPAIEISGSLTGGGAQADSHRTENTVKVNEVVSWTHGNHYVRAGIQLPQMSRRAVDDQTNRLGTYGFASLADRAANRAYVFTQQQGPGRGLYWINEFGSFVQDQIKLGKSVQVSLGLRYDWQSFLHDDNNFAPRVSVAYAPGGGKGKTILRAGTGVFYDRTGGDFPTTVVLHNGVTLRTAQVANVAYTGSAPAGLATVPSNIVRFAPDIRAPYTVQYSFGVERQVGKATLTAGYRGQVQAKSFRSRDANAPLLPAKASVSGMYARPDPNFGQIQQIESGGRSLLNALDLGFRGEAGRWFSGQAQYTFAHFENNTGGINYFPENQYRPNDEWGPADNFRNHRFTLLGNINPGHWLTLGVGAALLSGSRYTETTGTDDFHTGLANARPVGVGRNSLQGGGVATVDLLYDHDFRVGGSKAGDGKVLSAGVGAFNVMNRTKYTQYVGALSSPLFQQPIAAAAGRQMQFSVGYRF